MLSLLFLIIMLLICVILLYYLIGYTSSVISGIFGIIADIFKKK